MVQHVDRQDICARLEQTEGLRQIGSFNDIRQRVEKIQPGASGTRVPDSRGRSIRAVDELAVQVDSVAVVKLHLQLQSVHCRGIEVRIEIELKS